jgi:hypothetical protein
MLPLGKDGSIVTTVALCNIRSATGIVNYKTLFKFAIFTSL